MPDALDAIFARKIAYTKDHPFFREIHTPHLMRFRPTPWLPEDGELLVGDGWRVRAEAMDAPPGTFAVEELTTFFSDAGAPLGNGPLEIVLRVAGPATDRVSAESYTLDIAHSRIEIVSPVLSKVAHSRV